MSSPCARFATASPTRPSPTTPSVLPPSWLPVNLPRSQRPAFRLSFALATFRESASISATVCSAVETVLPPGVFITTMPCLVAEGTSMLSTPTPARTIALSRDWSRSTSAVSCVPERITMPSASARAARRPAGSSFVETITSSPGSARSSSRPSSASLSVTRTRCATVAGPFRSKQGGSLGLVNGWLSAAGLRRLPEEDPLRGGHRRAGLDSDAQVAQDHLQRREAADDVDLVHVAHVADADDLALELVL